MESTSSAITPAQTTSLWQTVWQSFMSALGSIVFKMEDGTVSIFGLVFGVAESATNSQTMRLAAATGAIEAVDVALSTAKPKARTNELRWRLNQKPATQLDGHHQALPRAYAVRLATSAVALAKQASP